MAEPTIPATVRVMTTPLAADGLPQPHPPDYHAEITAEKLIQVANSAAPEVQQAGRDMRKKFEAILTKFHTFVHDDEQAQLQKHGLDRHEVELDASHHMSDDLMDALLGATQGSILEGHFAKKEVQDAMRSELEHEARSQMNVHRVVHGHRHRHALKQKGA